MSRSNDQLYNNFINDAVDAVNVDFTISSDGSFEDLFGRVITNGDFLPILSPSSVSFESYQPISSVVSSQSNNQAVPGVNTSSSYNAQSALEMIEQPYQSSKLRYRADYTREKGRLGVLGNKNENLNMKGPAIRIPQFYLNSNNEYYIRVSLVTIRDNKTNLHYFHPYELEHPRNDEFNDRQNNSVWFPIEPNNSIKNFPLLRIVKKKTFHLQKLDHLHVFDCHNHVSQNNLAHKHFLKKDVDIIKEYNLEKSQLAFTIAKKVIHNAQMPMHLYPHTTIFSDEMIENNEKQSDSDTDTESSNERQTSSFSNRHIYKYAPRCGFVGNDDEMLIFLKRKLRFKKHGELQITFECNICEDLWSETVVNLDIKDRMISFKIPSFPYSITSPILVDIVLRQDDRILGVLKYSYIPVWQQE